MLFQSTGTFFSCRYTLFLSHSVFKRIFNFILRLFSFGIISIWREPWLNAYFFSNSLCKISNIFPSFSHIHLIQNFDIDWCRKKFPLFYHAPLTLNVRRIFFKYSESSEIFFLTSQIYFSFRNLKNKREVENTFFNTLDIYFFSEIKK